MPGIVDRLAAAKAAAMLADDCVILADHNAIGIGLDPALVTQSVAEFASGERYGRFAADSQVGRDR
jgi:hypothetical protein